MNKLILLISWRYLLGSRSEKNISAMLMICFISIFIGTFALALVASIMNGFEKITHEKLQGIHSQIIMRSTDGQLLDYPKIKQIIAQEFPQVTAISPTTYKQIIVQTPGSQEITDAVLLKAIEPDAETTTSAMGSKIVANSKPLQELVYANHIVIGQKLAKSLNLKQQENVSLLFIPEQQITNRKIALESKEAVVGGIFATGIDEFDHGLILASFDFTKDLFPESGVTQINIQLRPGQDEKTVIEQLKRRFGLDVFSWKDLYPALVAALKLEKYAMFFILALISLVACMNIISLIFMQIIQKRADIAIYHSMGMHTSTIRKLFMGLGIALCISAATAGLLAAYIMGKVLETFPFITLPDSYYVSHLPIAMEWHIFAAVFILVCLMSVIASYIPTRKINSKQIAHTLRFEA